MYDKYGNQYIDCISGYSALNQGHSHPRLINVAKKQIENLTLTSRAYSNDKLGMYSEKLCKTFGYDKVLLMNGGVESGESAIKIARKWGYNKKCIKPNKAINLFFNNNFWGRSIILRVHHLLIHLVMKGLYLIRKGYELFRIMILQNYITFLKKTQQPFLLCWNLFKEKEVLLFQIMVI